MYDLPNLPINQTKAFEALGNAVNVNLVKQIACSLLENRSSSPKKISPNARNFSSFISRLVT
jgi:hypothetical protein